MAEPGASAVGRWQAGEVGSIGFLDGGKLGAVTLVPAACGGDGSSSASSAAVPFAGTWRHGSVEDAGYGVFVRLTSADGALTCEKYLQ